MIDIARLTYKTIMVAGDGRQYDITDYITDLGWEENEKELAVRLSFTARNNPAANTYLSGIVQPGCMVAVTATDGTTGGEVARGYVEVWNTEIANGTDNLKGTCYDDLYKLQKSQDNRFYASGTGTKSAVCGILSDWGVPVAEYRGPDVSHGKKKFNNAYLSDMLLELLDDAKKKGAGQYLIRAGQGAVSVLPVGSNKTVYVFRYDDVKSFSRVYSSENLVTRVRVVGQMDDDGNSSVEATLNGLTGYGIRQRIYTRGSDEDLASAQSAAQEILNENGNISRKMTVAAPDVPFIRKGDYVYVIVWAEEHYYVVKSISHDAGSASMTMVLEMAVLETVGEGSVTASKEYHTGDVVNFRGGTHYTSSSGTKGYKAGAGPAKITRTKSGAAHPWHLVHTDSSSKVYGWVDDGTFD